MMPVGRRGSWVWRVVLGLMLGLPWTMGWEPGGVSLAQSEQVVEVTIKDYKFVTKQRTLRLGVPTLITVRNEDEVRHDFGSTMFEGIPTKIEHDGVIVYGRGLGGVFLDPKRDAVLRFDMSRPGRYEFRCSIHPNMGGELLLLSAEAV
jgi:plastocyanin